MASIQDMAPELLGLIFKNIYLASRAPRPGWYDSDSDSESESEETDNEWEHNLNRSMQRSYRRHLRDFPPDIEWTTESMHSPTKFPYNVANTCKLWRDVSLTSPENWEDIRFDLAHDPAPLLETFAASRNSLFSVLVFTTDNERTEECKIREAERSRTIILHLLPHMKRCTGIAFDLIFASSLPSPVPFLACNPPELRELILDYQVYDLPGYYKGTGILPKPTPSPPKKLTKMSMNGSAFMDIMHLGIKWLQALKTYKDQSKTKSMELYLRDFQFPACDNDEIFIRFIHLLHFFNPRRGIYFENICMAYRPDSETIPAVTYDLSDTMWASLSFKKVSRDFIAEFFDSSQIAMVECSVNFDSCSIPPISGGFFTPSLVLENVPGSESSFFEYDDSLRSIVSAWNGGNELTVIACPGFDDEFVSWLVAVGEEFNKRA